MSEPVLILVVEDDSTILHILEECLTDGGYTVKSATNGEDATALLDGMGLHLHALITDVDLAPGKLTGWEVGRRAREITHDLPIIYMTGASGSDWASKGVPKSLLLTKPFAPAQMVTAVSQLINQRGSPTTDT